MKKTILITGWTWYIWSHGVVAFEQAWYKTVIVDNLVNSSKKTLDGIKNILGYTPDFFEVDLRNKQKLKEVFEKYDFDWVIHFAWLKAVWESCQEPMKYFDNNINWSLVLFELMKDFWVKNIIFSSSATVYKEKNDWTWYTEIDPVWDCINPYGTTKFLIENILSDLSKFAHFNVVNLRYFNPIWAHNSWFIWENPNGIPNNLLPYVMKVATWELKEVSVFGDDYDTTDWTWVRDYIDVVDLIDWHLKAYEFLEKNKIKWFFETFNLWTGLWTSVLEIINSVSKVTQKNIAYKIVDRRPGDLAKVYCNPEKAGKILNWKAEVSLEKSIENMWRFYLSPIKKEKETSGYIEMYKESSHWKDWIEAFSFLKSLK